jgi:uncharacterized membrane protein YidH (DUF202 family)
VTAASPRDPPDRADSQPERTGLAWERGALAALVNGALLVLRGLRDPGSGTLVIAVGGLALAAAFAAIGASRARTLRAGRPLRTPEVAVPLVGIGTVLFGLAVAAALVVPGT